MVGTLPSRLREGWTTSEDLHLALGPQRSQGLQAPSSVLMGTALTLKLDVATKTLGAERPQIPIIIACACRM